MIKIEKKELLVGGKPSLILCGEIHYYRLDKKDWQDRITKLKEAGFNTVASYIPWLCHEEDEGVFDLDGHERPELDVIGFIDLCKQNDLYFIARPGPFIMAEMKNEGIPYWVAKKHPEIIPITWDNKVTPNPTLDYLAPAYLSCCKKWYEMIMPVLAKRLYQNGGNVIAVQLDNEIGMLSWCGNAPDLTELVCEDMANWMNLQYSKEELVERYPFDIMNEQERLQHFRSPQEEFSVRFHQDLGYYMRHRIAVYVRTLKEYANEYGVKDIPFLINIHGTSNNRCETYPIGISQLYEAYTMSDEYLSGSDYYLGSLTMANFQDLYLANSYMESVNRDNQPLTSLEFECGDGNYGERFSGRTEVSAADFKIRMSVAQGNRILNCYLFSGGRNYRLKNDYKDGNNRIAITGERHGFAAPIGPEGQKNCTYKRMARSIKTMGAMEDKITSMKEERDTVAFTFIPDYYMTEYCYPYSESANKQRANITTYRAANAFDSVARAALLAGYRFTSVNPQDKEIPNNLKTLVVFSAKYMAEKVQKRLAEFVKKGGGIYIHGEIPEFNMNGEACTILKDLFGITQIQSIKQTRDYLPCVNYKSYMKGFSDTRISYAEAYDIIDALPLMTLDLSGELCGFEKKVGKGKVVVISADCTCNPIFTRRIIESLGTKPELTHNCEEHGIFMTMANNMMGEKLLHIINLDDFEKKIKITYKGRRLFEGRELMLFSKDGMMLPLDINLDGKEIVYSTAEIYERREESMVLRLTQKEDVMLLNGTGIIADGKDYTVEETDGMTLVKSLKHGKIDEFITVYYRT